MTDNPRGKKRGGPRFFDPFSAFRAETDSVLDNFVGGAPPFPGIFRTGREGSLKPRMDVKETDQEIVVEAELPGLDEKDVSLTLQDGVLTIRGEKKQQHDEEKENYRMTERRYGSFERTLRLPDSIDEDKVDARFDNGLLKISLPKRPEAVGQSRTIQIKKGEV